MSIRSQFVGLIDMRIEVGSESIRHANTPPEMSMTSPAYEHLRGRTIFSDMSAALGVQGRRDCEAGSNILTSICDALAE